MIPSGSFELFADVKTSLSTTVVLNLSLSAVVITTLYSVSGTRFETVNGGATADVMCNVSTNFLSLRRNVDEALTSLSTSMSLPSSLASIVALTCSISTLKFEAQPTSVTGQSRKIKSGPEKTRTSSVFGLGETTEMKF